MYFYFPRSHTLEAAAEGAYYFELNSLLPKCWKKATEELLELMTGGGFHFMFFIYMATLFLLKASSLFVSASGGRACQGEQLLIQFKSYWGSNPATATDDKGTGGKQVLQRTY